MPTSTLTAARAFFGYRGYNSSGVWTVGSGVINARIASALAALATAVTNFNNAKAALPAAKQAVVAAKAALASAIILFKQRKTDAYAAAEITLRKDLIIAKKNVRSK